MATANQVEEQVVREAEDIEERKVGLMDSAKAWPMLPTSGRFTGNT
jgi:hypothetical protein